jgi:fatty acid-binding protein DegV
MATPTERRMTDPKKLIEQHKIPCGPMAVSIDGVCRRRLRDNFDALLDRLTQETHPEGRDPEEEDMDDEFELQEESKKKREEIERQLENDSKMLDNDIEGLLGYESLEDKKERMIEEGRMKAEVKKEVSKYEEKLMGNSKLSQNISGKIKKR